jgi:hypothetical protein
MLQRKAVKSGNRASAARQPKLTLGEDSRERWPAKPKLTLGEDSRERRLVGAGGIEPPTPRV